MNKISLYLLGGSLLWAVPSFPAGVEAGETSPGVMSLEGVTFRRQGTATLRYKRILKLYDATLYLGPGADPDDVLSDVPKRLEVTYARNLRAEDLNQAGLRNLQQQYSSEQLSTLRERLNTINGWYPDAVKNDRCALTYLPGKGTQLSYNGEILGWVEGADFAAVYFSIWLGPAGVSAPFRRQLLDGP